MKKIISAILVAVMLLSVVSIAVSAKSIFKQPDAVIIPDDDTAIEDEKDEDEDIKNPVSFKTLTILAIATSIDALAVGVTFATVPLAIHVSLASVLIGIVTYAISAGGVFIGSKCGNLLGNKAEILGGIVLIGIGTKILIEHLFF